MEDVWLNFAHTKYIMSRPFLLYEGGLIIIIRFTFRDHVYTYLSFSCCAQCLFLHTHRGRKNVHFIIIYLLYMMCCEHHIVIIPYVLYINT